MYLCVRERERCVVMELRDAYWMDHLGFAAFR